MGKERMCWSIWVGWLCSLSVEPISWTLAVPLYPHQLLSADHSPALLRKRCVEAQGRHGPSSSSFSPHAKRTESSLCFTVEEVDNRALCSKGHLHSHIPQGIIECLLCVELWLQFGLGGREWQAPWFQRTENLGLRAAFVSPQEHFKKTCTWPGGEACSPSCSGCWDRRLEDKASLRLPRHFIMILPQKRKQKGGWGGNGTVVQLVKCLLPNIKIGNCNQDPQDRHVSITLVLRGGYRQIPRACWPTSLAISKLQV